MSWNHHGKLPRQRLFQVPGQVLVHLEHADLVLAVKTAFSLASARISRLFAGSWRLFFLMYSQIFETVSPRESWPAPTTAASSAEGVKGFCRAFVFFSVAMGSPGWMLSRGCSGRR